MIILLKEQKNVIITLEIQNQNQYMVLHLKNKYLFKSFILKLWRNEF
jgi:hypothetical protein